jgi:CcmD family protein
VGYVIASYAVVIGAVGGYLLHLARERRRLVRELGADHPGHS